MKNRCLVIPALLICTMLLAGCQNEEPYLGVEAPAFELTSLDGQRVSLDDLQGSPTVIHFGTSWCPFCRAEDPHLEALHNLYKDKGVNVLVINVKEEDADAQTWYKEAGFTIPMLMDRDGQIAAAYAPADAQPALPRADVMIASNLIIDGDGVVRFFSLLDTDSFDAQLIELTERLDELLKEGA